MGFYLNKKMSKFLQHNLIFALQLRQVRIYTRTGDKGKSSLFTGERRPKDDKIFSVLGEVDELNSHIGLAASQLNSRNLSSLVEMMKESQSTLLDIGSHVATPSDKFLDLSSMTEKLENKIDEMTGELPALKNFILPGGTLSSSQLHVCRSVCRRCERSLVSLDDQVDPRVVSFVNRLSDFLFTAARMACHVDGGEETIYKKQKK